MAEQGGEKSEKPTAKHLQEAWDKGQFARSAEIQTAFVLLGGLMALLFTGREIYQHLGQLMKNRCIPSKFTARSCRWASMEYINWPRC